MLPRSGIRSRRVNSGNEGGNERRRFDPRTADNHGCIIRCLFFFFFFFSSSPLLLLLLLLQGREGRSRRVRRVVPPRDVRQGRSLKRRRPREPVALPEPVVGGGARRQGRGRRRGHGRERGGHYHFPGDPGMVGAVALDGTFAAAGVNAAPLPVLPQAPPRPQPVPPLIR